MTANGNSKEKVLLKVEALSKAFGGVRAQEDVSFSVPGGSLTGIIGPNGAGKTTLFNLITGVLTPDSGRILFSGDPIQGRPIHKLVRKGIARTFQNVELFESMTVLENVMVGQYSRTRCGFFGAVFKPPHVIKEENQAKKQALSLLSFVGLKDQAEKRSGDLPLGWQRLLEIARALASRPRLLLLDEPAAGLNAVETERLGKVLSDIKNQDVTLLLVEHDMSLTMEVCDTIIVLDQGRLLAVGTPRQVQSDPKVMAAYLGEPEKPRSRAQSTRR